MVDNTRHWRFLNPKKVAAIIRSLHYRNKYGITIDDYNQLLEQQHGYCRLCSKHQSEFKRRLDVDHNHKTGKIRGLVCNGCNRTIGKYENKQLKNKKLMKKIEIYLAKSK